jgi:ferredoxin
MPRVWIDNREVTVAAGSTLLDATRALGIDVPTLCWRDGCRPNTTCMVCVVKVAARHEGTTARRHEGGARAAGRLVPSCATIAEDGMRVASETDGVREVRRAALDLLLSDHAGECRAPCQHACPLGVDVPNMIRQVAAGRLADAITTVRNDVALAAVLGRMCPESCEHACRRGVVDDPASICLLKRYVADKDLASSTPYVPPRTEDSGKRVAIVGAGPAGLSAAYFLQRRGHACTLFDSHEKPGGMLRNIAEQQLPRRVLAAEIALIEKLGARFELNTTIGAQRTLDELRGEFDAVLLAVGKLGDEGAGRLGLVLSDGRLHVNGKTHETGLEGVFAAGDVVLPRGRPVLAVAAGKDAAICVDQYLRGVTITGHRKLFVVRTGRPRREEIAAMVAATGPAARTIPNDVTTGFTDQEARAEAERCLHCDCRKLETCRLRKYAEMYGADGRHYRGQRRQVQRVSSHPDIIYEPGKCILCGLCVQIAERACEPLGLTLIGRGFDVRVAVPFDEPLAEALTFAARQCVEACPTGALARRDGFATGCQGCSDALDPKQ